MFRFFGKIFNYFTAGYPKYCIVEYKNRFFPLKRRFLGYHYMITDMYGEELRWEAETMIQEVCFEYPGLHAFSSFSKAKKVIEKVDDIELIKVDGPVSNYYGNAKQEVYFEEKSRKSFVKDKNEALASMTM